MSAVKLEHSSCGSCDSCKQRDNKAIGSWRDLAALEQVT